MPDPKKNAAYSFSLSLVATAARPNFQSSPTLAAGDFKVSIDEGAFNNLATLPTVSPAAGRNVKVSLSAAEMNGDRIVVQAVDAAGAQWDEVMVAIQTTVSTTDEIKTETASIQADTNDIQTKMDPVRSGTAQAGAAGSITLDAGASASTNFYKDMIVYLTSGLGAGQARLITAYDGGTKVATVSPNWVVTPNNTTVFNILIGTETSGGSAPTAATIADAVWDEAIAGHLTGGSTGAALNAAGGAGDPWITTLPGAYVAGQAGFIVGTNLNATVTSRASQTSVDTVQADTDDIQTRLPAALVGGKIDASVGTLGIDSVNANALAPDAVTEIANGVRDMVIEGGVTFQQSMRLQNAANGGKLSGAATSNVLVRDLADSKNRINATVDLNGNRAAVTLDLT